MNTPVDYADLFSREVSVAVERAEALRARMLAWPPVNGANQKRHRTLEQVMSDELGFLD